MKSTANPKTWSRRKVEIHPNPLFAKYGLSITFEERFWKKVNKTNSCWIWTGCKCQGYGHASRGSSFNGFKSMIRAHAASWIINKGEIPDGLCVLHNCPGGDNRSCVNPDHLWIGTKKDNSQDALKKGVHRSFKGELHARHKLTWEQVREIRVDNRKTGARKLAKKYRVSRAAIRFVLSGNTWID